MVILYITTKEEMLWLLNYDTFLAFCILIHIFKKYILDLLSYINLSNMSSFNSWEESNKNTIMLFQKYLYFVPTKTLFIILIWNTLWLPVSSVPSKLLTCLL